MDRPASIAAIGLIVILLAGCTTQGLSNFTCPVPAGKKPIVSEEPPRRGDKFLLSDPSYFAQMIKHGSNDDLRALIRRAESRENYQSADHGLVDKVRYNLKARIQYGCRDVPSFSPEEHYIIQPAMGNMVE